MMFRACATVFLIGNLFGYSIIGCKNRSELSSEKNVNKMLSLSPDALAVDSSMMLAELKAGRAFYDFGSICFNRFKGCIKPGNGLFASMGRIQDDFRFVDRIRVDKGTEKLIADQLSNGRWVFTESTNGTYGAFSLVSDGSIYRAVIEDRKGSLYARDIYLEKRLQIKSELDEEVYGVTSQNPTKGTNALFCINGRVFLRLSLGNWSEIDFNETDYDTLSCKFRQYNLGTYNNEFYGLYLKKGSKMYSLFKLDIVQKRWILVEKVSPALADAFTTGLFEKIQGTHAFLKKEISNFGDDFSNYLIKQKDGRYKAEFFVLGQKRNLIFSLKLALAENYFFVDPFGRFLVIASYDGRKDWLFFRYDIKSSSVTQIGSKEVLDGKKSFFGKVLAYRKKGPEALDDANNYIVMNSDGMFAFSNNPSASNYLKKIQIFDMEKGAPSHYDFELSQDSEALNGIYVLRKPGTPEKLFVQKFSIKAQELDSCFSGAESICGIKPTYQEIELDVELGRYFNFRVRIMHNIVYAHDDSMVTVNSEYVQNQSSTVPRCQIFKEEDSKFKMIFDSKYTRCSFDQGSVMSSQASEVQSPKFAVFYSKEANFKAFENSSNLFATYELPAAELYFIGHTKDRRESFSTPGYLDMTKAQPVGSNKALFFLGSEVAEIPMNREFYKMAVKTEPDLLALFFDSGNQAYIFKKSGTTWQNLSPNGSIKLEYNTVHTSSIEGWSPEIYESFSASSFVTLERIYMILKPH